MSTEHASFAHHKLHACTPTSIFLFSLREPFDIDAFEGSECAVCFPLLVCRGFQRQHVQEPIRHIMTCSIFMHAVQTCISPGRIACLMLPCLVFFLMLSLLPGITVAYCWTDQWPLGPRSTVREKEQRSCGFRDWAGRHQSVEALWTGRRHHPGCPV
jgi:hypothetical protein